MNIMRKKNSLNVTAGASAGITSGGGFIGGDREAKNIQLKPHSLNLGRREVWTCQQEFSPLMKPSSTAILSASLGSLYKIQQKKIWAGSTS